jgi:hypothetical protein
LIPRLIKDPRYFKLFVVPHLQILTQIKDEYERREFLVEKILDTFTDSGCTLPYDKASTILDQYLTELANQPEF